MIILLIIIIIIQTNSKIIRSICMDDFLSIDIEKLEEDEEIKNIYYKPNELQECYDYISEMKTKIRGFNTYAECYVNKEYLTINFGNNLTVSRCGQWLQIVGPSQTAVLCMVAGTHNITAYKFPNVPIIAMRTEIFDGLTHKMTLQSEILTPVTVAQADFDLTTNPKLFVTYTNEGYNLLHFVDTNKLPAKISILGIEYFMDKFGRFKISYKGGLLLSVSLISFSNERIDFHDVDLSDKTKDLKTLNKTTMTKEYSTQSRFPNEIMSKCHYLAENHVYEEGVVRINKFFHWTLTKVNTDKDGNHIETENIFNQNQQNKFIVDITNEYFNVEMFMSSSASILSNAFKWLEIRLETNFDVNKYELLEAYFEGQNSTKDLRKLIGVPDVISSSVKYSLNETTREIFIKLSFPISHILFIEKIIVRQRIKESKGNEGYKITVKNITFIRLDKYSQQPSCSSEAMYCKGTECTIPEERYEKGVTPWESKYCMPICGECQVGFFCNSSGQCQADINLNTRSYSIGCYVLMYIIMIVLLM